MVSVQTLPRSAEAYYDAQRAESQAALRAVQRQWLRLAPGAVVASWEDLRPALLAVILTAQGRLARPGAGFVSAVLAETGSAGLDDPFMDVSPAALVGFTGDGRSVEGLIDLAPGKVLDGQTPRQAGEWLNLAASSVLSDTGRQSVALEMAVRPRASYVRMLNPPSCSRCATLAGKPSKSVAFPRHPGCDCRAIPSAEAVAGDMTVDTQAYFDSLPESEQARVFTVAGAESIRAGADPAAVVNARRGMTTVTQNLRGWIPQGRLTRSNVLGQQVYTTAEGAGRGRRRGRRVRLMPESIVELAKDREDLTRLLRVHGYVR